jgi:hypothetical protein
VGILGGGRRGAVRGRRGKWPGGGVGGGGGGEGVCEDMT